MDPLRSETSLSILNIFKYFIIILIVSTNYIFVHLLDNKVFYSCHFVRFPVKKFKLLLHTPQRRSEGVAALSSQKRLYYLFSERMDGR